MPPVIAAIGAISAGITSALSAALAGITAGGLISFTSLSAFIASPIGGLLVGIGLQLVLSPFLTNKGNATKMEAGKVNIRVSEPLRWIHIGLIRSGGGVLFAEFDANGNFWYVIVHSDSLCGNIIKRYFDDIEITTDSNGNVTTNDFCLNTKKDIYTGSGTKVTYFRIWTTTYTASNPTPPGISELRTAFPGVNGWTTDHKLVGTTYSVVKIKPLNIEHRYKIYKWRGPVGIGEPAFTIVAEWSKCYDPRDLTQSINDPTTYKFSRNPALIWANFRIHKYGRNKAITSINWTKLAEQADICDQSVLDKDGNPHTRWRCDTAIPEDKERASAEQEILMSCDGQLVFDDDGKCWPRVGYYYTPTVNLYRNRDIVAMESVIAQDQDSETQGVIVRFLDPSAAYAMQPSAAYDNPIYYVEGQTSKYLSIDIPTCQDHNQAMRLAKAYAYRSQPSHKLAPTTGLRGLKSRSERIINLNYDNEFSGDYEIVVPVEVDKNGIFCGLAIVPIDENRWTLLAGEEKDKPVYNEIVTSNNLQLPTNVIVSFDGMRLNVSFDEVPRDDWRYQFQYKLSTATKWLDMTVNMTESTAIGGGIQLNKTYNVQYRTIASSGKTSEYIDPPISIYTNILTLSGTPVTTGTVGTPYTSWSIGASGGDTPYTFYDVYSRLPTGISVNPSTGLVSGTPTVAGTYADIIIRVIDANGIYANFPSFTITIAP